MWGIYIYILRYKNPQNTTSLYHKEKGRKRGNFIIFFEKTCGTHHKVSEKETAPPKQATLRIDIRVEGYSIWKKLSSNFAP